MSDTIPGIISTAEEIKKFIKQYDKNDNTKTVEIPKEIFDKCCKEWKYKLRLGKEAYLSTADIPQILGENDFLVIKPGDFVLLQTEEIVELDENVMGFISMRFDYKQKGLINVSGFHVDPNYRGHLLFSAFNAGPKDIIIRRKDEVFMIFFERLTKSVSRENVLNKRIEYRHIPSSMIEQIRGKSATLTDISNRLKKLEIYFTVFVAVIVPLIVALFGWLISKK